MSGRRAAFHLVAIHNWTFLLGPGFVAGLGNGLILGYLMYRSGLLPRRVTLLGLIGGPLLAASGIAILFGLFKAGSALQGIATIPEFLWEAFLGLWLTFKGFNPSASPLETRSTRHGWASSCSAIRPRSRGPTDERETLERPRRATTLDPAAQTSIAAGRAAT